MTRNRHNPTAIQMAGRPDGRLDGWPDCRLAAGRRLTLGLRGRGEEGCNRPPDPTSLHRVEIAACVTFCAKLSAACETVAKYEALDAEAQAA